MSTVWWKSPAVKQGGHNVSCAENRSSRRLERAYRPARFQLATSEGENRYGARTSALSAAYYVLRADVQGRQVADIVLALDRRKPKNEVRVTTPVLAIVTVKCTGGLCEKRPVIETRVRIGSVTKRVLFTLTDRSHMLTPLILGRQARQGDFVVDAGRKYLQRKPR